MASRFTRRLEFLFALALLGSAIACGDARPVLSKEESALTCLRCHGQPPETNAHLAHTTLESGATGVPHAALACTSCHRDVQGIDGPDHILRSDGKPVGRAEVRFDDPESLGNRTQEGAARAAAAAYDPATRTCSNVYCHGATLRGAAPQFVAAVAWTDPAGSVGCGTCHGLPPANHPAGITTAQCATCHGAAIDAAGKPNPNTHVNGTVDLADTLTSRSCSGCHGDRSVTVSPGDPRSAPPGDAQGRADSNAVGAHQNHVVAGVLGAAVACKECHVVPSSLFAPGHIDGPRATLTFGALAAKGGLAPSYDAATQTCSNVYCHGNFPNSRVTAPPKPAWGGGAAAVACGTCHGTPPPSPAHPEVVDVVAQGCSTSTIPALACHPAPTATTRGFSYDPATGKGTVDPKLHIDGKICPPQCD